MSTGCQQISTTNKDKTTFYCLDNITKFEDFDCGNISLDKKSYENILIYDISDKTLIGVKPWRGLLFLVF